VSLSLQDYGARNYYWKVKIQKSGSGTILSAVSGNTLAQSRTLKTIMRWADGDQGC